MHADPKLLNILNFLRAALWFSKAQPESGKSQVRLAQTISPDRDYVALLHTKILEELTAGHLVIVAGAIIQLGYPLPIICRYAQQ